MTEKINLSFTNTEKIDSELKIDIPTPGFALHKPPLKEIISTAKKFEDKKKMVLIGNGGSNTSFKGFSGALSGYTKKDFFVLQTMEPEQVLRVKKGFLKKETVIVTTSKSGTNVDSFEPLIALKGYPTIVVTQFNNNPLLQYAKINNYTLFEHPEIGGRYSGLTASQLMPASVLGLPIKKIFSGAKKGYKQFNPKHKAKKNPALKLAVTLHELEKKGFTELFAAFYSYALHSFQPLLTQLVHESFCKKGKGQTVFGDLGPEMQHHTNQRFFGGKKNAVGLFFNVKKHEKEVTLKLTKQEQKIRIRNAMLKVLNNEKLSQSLYYDMKGVISAAKKLGLPVTRVELNKISPESIGFFTAFLQYFTVYSSVLRKVNPFNQPAVELAKNIAFKLRANKKKKKI